MSALEGPVSETLSCGSGAHRSENHCIRMHPFGLKPFGFNLRSIGNQEQDHFAVQAAIPSRRI